MNDMLPPVHTRSRVRHRHCNGSGAYLGRARFVSENNRLAIQLIKERIQTLDIGSKLRKEVWQKEMTE